jgi:predicted nucleic acid-binding Zn ribbon protein
MTDVGSIREQATENDRRRQKRWRLSASVISAIIGMLLWLALAHIIPK